MRNSFRLKLAAVAVAVAAAGTALSGAAVAQSYPRVVGTGMDLTIDYGPAGQGNLVGGGRVTVTQPDGMTVNIMHLDAMFSQQPRPGFIPMVIGSGENRETIYVPAAMLDMVRSARSGVAPR